MLPDLPLHQVRLLLDHAAAGCSPFPPLLLFKPLLPVPPPHPRIPLVHGWVWKKGPARVGPSFQVLRWPCKDPLGQGGLGTNPIPKHRALGEIGLTIPPF